MSHVLNSAESLKKLTAYEVVSEEALPDISAYGIVLRHKKSGARVAVISCAEEAMEDSTKAAVMVLSAIAPSTATGVSTAAPSTSSAVKEIFAPSTA